MSASTGLHNALGLQASSLDSNLQTQAMDPLQGQASHNLLMPATSLCGDARPLKPTTEIGCSTTDAPDLPTSAQRSRSASPARKIRQGRLGLRSTATMHSAAPEGFAHKMMLQLKRALSLAPAPPAKVAAATPDAVLRPRMIVPTTASCCVHAAEGGEELGELEASDESSQVPCRFRLVCI
jgi:hypothetical protein